MISRRNFLRSVTGCTVAASAIPASIKITGYYHRSWGPTGIVLKNGDVMRLGTIVTLPFSKHGPFMESPKMRVVDVDYSSKTVTFNIL